MTDTRTALLNRYYQEQDPLKRKKILEKSIAEGEEPEKNKIRMEMWEVRYKEKSRALKGNRTDGFLRLWMTLKYADGNTGGFFGGTRRLIKDINKILKELQFSQFQEKGGLYGECLYDECCHLVDTYLTSCETDKNYGSGLMGLMSLSKEKVVNKMTSDLYTVAIKVPRDLHLEEELALVTKAAKEVYARRFQLDEFDELTEIQEELLH